MSYTAVLTRVSVNSDGIGGDNLSRLPSLSRDGRYVAFQSYAENLVDGVARVPDITGEFPSFPTLHVYLHDSVTGETTLVSINSDGIPAESVHGIGGGFSPIISEDGRYVVFNSESGNLDDKGHGGIFVHDRITAETTRVNVAGDGAENSHISFLDFDLSADGRYATFSSFANNLVDGDTNGEVDIFVHDRDTGLTTRVSVDSEGAEAANSADDGSVPQQDLPLRLSETPTLSGEGRYVAFSSYADNLVEGDNNGLNDVFVHDRETGLTTRVSVASDGTEATVDEMVASGSGLSVLEVNISADGRFVSFISVADNLVSGDTNNRWDAFVHDRLTGETTRVNVNSDGTETNGGARHHSLSGDGRYVVFSETGGDCFVHDRTTGETVSVFAAVDGILSALDINISSDGSTIGFSTHASFLLAEDTNAVSDTFILSNPLFEGGLDLVGTIGNDRLNGSDRNEVLNGREGQDILNGREGQDILNGGTGNDILNGGTGRDILNGGAGNDILNGGAENDDLPGAKPVTDLRDLIFGGDGDDIIDGGYGNDELRGDAGDDTIAGGFGADTVIGGTGDDILTGSAFSDLLFGGDGMDFVNGGFGHDRVNGGADADRFFHIGIRDHGSDWIQDYNSAEGDTLLFGIGTATGADFRVTFAHTENAAGERSGDDAVQEAFVIYSPTGQVMWALVDGAGESSINIEIGGITYDLLA